MDDTIFALPPSEPPASEELAPGRPRLQRPNRAQLRVASDTKHSPSGQRRFDPSTRSSLSARGLLLPTPLEDLAAPRRSGILDRQL
jgi:hypothetical protein